MITKLTPTYFYDKIEDIPFELLEENNITGLIFDADNTIIDYTKVVSKEKKAWLDELKKRGYNICILSNTVSEKKIRNLMKELDVHGLYLAMKPLLKGFNMALNLLDAKKENVIMIGDQLFTDVLGANRFGIKSIFVNPMHKREDLLTIMKRPLEKYYLKKIKEKAKEK